MAKVEGPLFSLGAEGTFASAITFGNNRGRIVARKRATPSNPNTARQMAIRSHLAALSAAWAGLTEAQREAWKEYAAAHPHADPETGKMLTVTGFNAFVALNALILDTGGTQADNPPATAAPDPLGSVHLQISSDGDRPVTLVFDPSPVPAGQVLDVWLYHSPSVGRTPGEGQYRHLSYIAAAQTTPQTLVAASEPGCYFARARFVDKTTGLYSAWMGAHDLRPA